MISKRLKQHIRVSTFLVFMTACISSSVWAANYYVDATVGNDGNSGTQSAPWKTLTKVNATGFKPGDSVYFHSGQQWSAALIPVSGSSSGFVTYSSYGSGAKPILRNCNATGKTYVKIQGLQFSSTTADYPLYINDSSYIWVEDCDIYGESSCTAYAAARIYMNSHHNKIVRCKIAHRNLSKQNDALNLKYNCNYNLIEGNTIGTATHYALTLEGSSSTYPGYVCSNNIIRNNTINNPEGAVVELQSNANRNVFEGNTVTGGKTTSLNSNEPRSFKSVSKYNIIRRNVIFDNTQQAGSGISSQAYQYSTDPANNVISNRVYNNVITGIYTNPIILDNFEPTTCQVTDNVYKNNIIYGNGVSNGYQLVITSVSNITSNYFNNNIFYKSSSTNVVNLKGTAMSVATAQTKDSAHFSGNIQKDPVLDGNYHPYASSPAIDAGAHLTQVTSDSGSGTTFTVQDAGFFTDGFGMTQGDRIRIGNTTSTIIAVNYSTNTITVADAISWVKGAPVSEPFSGSAPDMGAYEFGLTPPLNLTIVY